MSNPNGILPVTTLSAFYPMNMIKIIMTVCVLLSGHLAAHANEPVNPVRLAVVNVADDILIPLIDQFQKSSATKVRIVYTGNDPFSVARAGEADLVIAHYGHPLVQQFVEDRSGLFPRPVFANQVAILGPKTDPAGIRGMSDAAAALKRIADSGAKIHTNGHGANFLLDLLSISAGMSQNDSWILKRPLAGKAAVQSAANQDAYIIWGVPPFIRQSDGTASGLDILVSDDPIFQRIMVAIRVNPDKISATNAAGARAFEHYLLSPPAQAQIRAFRYAGRQQQFWWPAARHNSLSD